MDWQLWLFRFGLLACFAGIVVAATQFDVSESIEALWIQAPTTQEIQTERVTSAKRVAICMSGRAKTRGAEYASGCFYREPTIPELAGDIAVTNLLGFLVTLLAVFAALIALGFLGVRMARESRA